ncbi:MAG: Hsp20 family protein [Pseudomonadota bacterium]
MSRVSRLNSPFMLGFEHFEQTLDRISKAAGDGYPPYNIEQLGENGLRITLAVAGFMMDDLSVEVADNQLVIRGRHNEDGQDGRVFLHRGIASRQFQRSFVLADGIEVASASLDNGLLNIDLVRPLPETVVRTIKIDGPNGGKTPDEADRIIDVGGKSGHDGKRR